MYCEDTFYIVSTVIITIHIVLSWKPFLFYKLYDRTLKTYINYSAIHDIVTRDANSLTSAEI